MIRPFIFVLDYMVILVNKGNNLFFVPQCAYLGEDAMDPDEPCLRRSNCIHPIASGRERIPKEFMNY